MPASRYPTSEEIMAKVPKLPDALVHHVKLFRRLWPFCHTQEQKRHLLRALLLAIDRHHRPKKASPLHTVIFSSDLYSGMYNREDKTIYLCNESLITALHELAHHFYGSSELKACRWSTHLFRQAWPSAFAKLKWRGHMLVR